MIQITSVGLFSLIEFYEGVRPVLIQFRGFIKIDISSSHGPIKGSLVFLSQN